MFMPLSTFPSPRKDPKYAAPNRFGISDQLFNAIIQQNNIQSDENSGEYTPTLFNDSNILSSTAYPCQYMRVGNAVTVSGRFDATIDLTLSVTEMGISLPPDFPSIFSDEENCAGVAASNKGDGYSIRADTANNRAQFYALPVPTGGETYWFIFTYFIFPS